MKRLLFEIAKLKAKARKAKEFLKMYKLWCKTLNKTAEIKWAEVYPICESPYKTGFYACPHTSKNCLSCPYVKKQDCPLCGEKMQDKKFCFNPLCRNYDD